MSPEPGVALITGAGHGLGRPSPSHVLSAGSRSRLVPHRSRDQRNCGGDCPQRQESHRHL